MKNCGTVSCADFFISANSRRGSWLGQVGRVVDKTERDTMDINHRTGRLSVRTGAADVASRR